MAAAANKSFNVKNRKSDTQEVKYRTFFFWVCKSPCGKQSRGQAPPVQYASFEAIKRAIRANALKKAKRILELCASLC
jgi:hypothetical protein